MGDGVSAEDRRAPDGTPGAHEPTVMVEFRDSLVSVPRWLGREIIDQRERARAAKPLIRTPNGIPDGWHVSVDDDGVPRLARSVRPEDASDASKSSSPGGH